MLLIALLIPLGLAILVYAYVLAREAIGRRAWPTPEALALGAVVNFFDTFGIGSFAQTTAWFKFRKLVPDRLIPPTMIAGLTPPAMVESIIFLILLGVRVDPVLLFGGAMATFVGGIVGAPLVVRARAWIVQMTVAIGLAMAGIANLLAILGSLPAGGTASGLPMGLTIVAIVASFGFGLLANFGVGNYAPTLAMLSLMGMDPHYCFPIMASGASLMGAGSSVRFVKVPEIDLRIVVGLALGGIPAVLVAALIVKEMDVDVLRWVITVVVFYTAVVMARAAVKGHREHRLEATTAQAAAL
ncbi:TSUP family transporter [Sphingomonas alba]|uniref:Probable membrane transporter protein n=1 Tax=Sphingomonas alba TaxID=2908208 RepID=A0ABT0RK09_9SPHN|nr:TSUP family transporter [Sphingomonas alba]MCL6682634.1 TSUP family transporter [Sphingomonas alba]